MSKTLFIEGMSCSHCVAHVENALSEISGVEKVKVNLKKKLAKVKLSEEVNEQVLKDAVSEAGYEVVRIED